MTYGDNNKGKILGVGKISMNPSISIENILLVDGLKHSLLIVNQLYEKAFWCHLILIIALLKVNMTRK